MDDLEVAQSLGIPYLGADPKVVEVYGTKSGAVRLFRKAGVPLPPSECDIFTEQQVKLFSFLVVKRHHYHYCSNQM